MKKSIFSLLTISSLLILSSCGGGGGADTQTDTGDSDSLHTEMSEETNFEATSDEVKKIDFEIFADSGAVALVESEPDSPGATFKEEILVVTQVPSQTNLEAIQAILQKVQNYTGDAKQALAQKKTEYLDDYVEMNSEEMVGMSADWYKESTVEVVFNNDYFTTIGFYSDEYGGGARSFYSSSYLVLDLKNSKKITLSDIFDADGIDKLTQKLTEEALAMAKEEGALSLEDAGFMVEKVEPTERFLVDKQGLRFEYAQAEITFRAVAPPVFLFEWSELKDIMKSDSPLRVWVR
ncbi:MAG: hypothetical protein JJT94_00225 [Bernardetiaceae bacterium]|nr:hypothetical protein [Bernardetiaceae bacterium]